MIKKRKPLQPGSFLELWLLSFLFVVVIGGLLQLQNIQAHEQEVARSLEVDHVDTFNEITRNNTPALGY